MAKELASWLKKEYEVTKSGDVVSKTKYQYQVDDKTYEIPEDAVWIQTFGSRKNPDLITRCVPTLKHTFCLELADRHKKEVKLGTATRYVVTYPHQNPGSLYGYMTIINDDGVFADGEVCKATLNESMYGYAATMMQKRAEDRLILRSLGLYQKGWYSAEEFGGQHVDITKEDSFESNSANALSEDERKRALDNGVRAELLRDIGTFMKQIKETTPDWDGRMFCKNLVDKEPEKNMANYTTDEMKIIYKSLKNTIDSLTD